MIPYLIALSLTIANPDRCTVVDSCHVCELNQVCGEFGPGIRQFVFWEYLPHHNAFAVRHWRMASTCELIQYENSRACWVTWDEGGKRVGVYSRCLYVSQETFDPEIRNKDTFPEANRRRLFGR